jgi:hypothetical protein
MPPRNPAVKLNDLTNALSEAISKGNISLVNALEDNADRSVTLHSSVQENSKKVGELDTEVKLVKGVIVSLVGSGDGSSGLIPRMEKDMTGVVRDVSGIKSDIQGIKEDISQMLNNNKEDRLALIVAMKEDRAAMMTEMIAIRTSQSRQNTFLDGWKGVGKALGILAAGAGILLTILECFGKVRH